MNIATHRFRRNATGDRDIDYASISLPNGLGVDLSSARDETAPTAPAIRVAKRKPAGCAVRKPPPYDVVRAVLVELAEGRL